MKLNYPSRYIYLFSVFYAGISIDCVAKLGSKNGKCRNLGQENGVQGFLNLY